MQVATSSSLKHNIEQKEESSWQQQPLFHQLLADNRTNLIAITIIGVYGLIFVAGTVGNSLLVHFFSAGNGEGKDKRSHRSQTTLINLFCSHLLFMFICLPGNAYKTLIQLVVDEWSQVHIICQIIPYIESVILGVTSLSFCVMAVSQYRNAANIGKYDVLPEEKPMWRACKVLVIWFIALTLSLPELLLNQVVTVTTPGVGTVTMRHDSSGDNLEPTSAMIHDTANTSTTITRCLCVGDNNTTWSHFLPTPLSALLDFYSRIRFWWSLSFSFLLPIAITLLFSVLIKGRLTRAVSLISQISTRSNGSFSPIIANDCGTFDSTRSRHQHMATDTMMSGRTNVSLYRTHHQQQQQQQQQSTSLNDRHRHTISSFQQQQTRMSPLFTHDEIDELKPPHPNSSVVLMKDGSLKTTSSFRPDFPHSPVSLLNTRDLSLLSLSPSSQTQHYGAGTLKTSSSLPPHGYGRNFRRRNSRVLRLTMINADREGALNWAILAMMAGFMLTQLPIRVFDVLSHETNMMLMIGEHWPTLLHDTCQYLNCLTFALSSVVMAFAFPPYKRFLVYRVCSRNVASTSQ